MIDSFDLDFFGYSQLCLIVAAMVIYLSPFTLFHYCYREEPAPRVVQLAYPTTRRFKFIPIIFVWKTVILHDWYVASISEYGGARGTTAAKVLSTTTAVTGTLQIILAMLIYSYCQTQDIFTSDVTIARLVLMIVGGVGCILIGQAESAIPWRDGRRVDIRWSWKQMSKEKQEAEMEALQQWATQQITKYEEKSVTAVDFTNNQSSLYPSLYPDEKHEKLMIHGVEFASLPRTTTPPATIQLSNYDILDKHNLCHCLNELDYKVNLPLQVLQSIAHDVYSIPEEQRLEIYYQYRTLTDLPFNIHEKEYNVNVLFNDEKEKSLYSFLHMSGALGVVFCNLSAEVLASVYDINSYRYPFLIAVVGFVFFVVFCAISWLSGNYSLPCCKSSFFRQCPQKESNNYTQGQRYCCSLLFILTETIAFSLMMVAIAVEAVYSSSSIKEFN